MPKHSCQASVGFSVTCTLLQNSGGGSGVGWCCKRTVLTGLLTASEQTFTWQREDNPRPNKQLRRSANLHSALLTAYIMTNLFTNHYSSTQRYVCYR